MKMKIISERKDMSLQHKDIWKLLGVERAKFRKIRPFHPNEKKRNFSARDAFAFKILMKLVRGNVTDMKDMYGVDMAPFFRDIEQKSHQEIKKSIVLWHETEEYIKVINREDEFDRDDFDLNSLSLKRFYIGFLHELGEIGVSIPTKNMDRSLEVINGGKKEA